MSERPIQPPDHDELVADLALLRRSGIVNLHKLDLPALTQAVLASGDDESDRPVTAARTERLLRAGVADLGSGRLGDCAALLFGLEPGTRGDSPANLRRDAAERWCVSLDRFRRAPQETILSEIAHAILRRVELWNERLAHLALERRLPPSSRLAIAWLERFEEYYRIWTPTSGIAVSLCAGRSTLLEEGRIWDQPPGTDGPEDQGCTQEQQAAGYMSDALWFHTEYLACVREFVVRRGGLWLLSDEKAEQDVANAIYEIGWNSPLTEDDESYLRNIYRECDGEIHRFTGLTSSDPILTHIHDKWHEWAALCACNWNASEEVDIEHFPTHRHHRGISVDCQVHSMVRACNDYCTLIDDDWKRIADWYRLPTQYSRISNDRQLYENWLAGQRAEGQAEESATQDS